MEDTFGECILTCFTETWLHDANLDFSVTTVGFSSVRGNRRQGESGKRKEGGLAILINNRWCSSNRFDVELKSSLQKRPGPPVFSAEAQVFQFLQHHAVDVLQVMMARVIFCSVERGRGAERVGILYLAY